jgi:hypothetical protein
LPRMQGEDYDAIELSVLKPLSFNERDRVRMGLPPGGSRGNASRGTPADSDAWVPKGDEGRKKVPDLKPVKAGRGHRRDAD